MQLLTRTFHYIIGRMSRRTLCCSELIPLALVIPTKDQSLNVLLIMWWFQSRIKKATEYTHFWQGRNSGIEIINMVVFVYTTNLSHCKLHVALSRTDPDIPK